MGMGFTYEILVDSFALYDTITTLLEPREYRLRKVVARMRDAFESGDLNGVKWIQRLHGLADALTKPSTVLACRLNKMLAGGVWDEMIENEKVEL